MEEIRDWEMCVDTSTGYVKIFVKAYGRIDALMKFRNYVKSTNFYDKYGNLYDFKEHTIK